MEKLIQLSCPVPELLNCTAQLVTDPFSKPEDTSSRVSG